MGAYARGHDSEPELQTYVALARARLAPDHTNVCVVGPTGRVGPVDGYYECGVAYEYDGSAAHAGFAQRRKDEAKRGRVRRQQVDVVPLDARHLKAPALLISAVRDALARRSTQPPPLGAVEHLERRSCVCGWLPERGTGPVLSTGT